MCCMPNPIQIEPNFATNEIVNVIYLCLMVIRSLSLRFEKKYYVDQIEQITRLMLIAQNTKLANHQLMFLNTAFQPKSQRQGII